MKRILIVTLVIIVLLSLAACAAGPNAMEGSALRGGKPAGFLLGIWHGFISLFTFIISLFSDKVGVYEVNNNGGWYNFGFILGLMMFYGGGGSRTCSRK